MEPVRSFLVKLAEIRDGLRHGGIACLIVNSGVTGHDKVTGQELPPQFEVNLPTGQMQDLLEKTFAGWQVIKHIIALILEHPLQAISKRSSLSMK